MSVTHSFSVDVAIAVGDRSATILNNFAHWHLKNGVDERNVIDGFVWTYNSVSAYAKVWPYLTAKQIRTSLDGLEEMGYLKTGNYNEWKTDKTKWYALTEKACEILKIPFLVELVHLPKKANGIAQKGKSVCPKGQMDLPEKADGFAQMGEPIPVIKPIEEQLENQPQQPEAEPISERVEEVEENPNFLYVSDKINQARKQVLAGQIIRNNTCMSLKITAEFYNILVNAFFDEQIGLAETKKEIDLSHIKDHQMNWLRVQVRMGNQSRFHPQFLPVNPIRAGNAYQNGHSVPLVSAKFTSPLPD